MSGEDLDCQKCGACCAGQLVLVLPRDNPPLHMTDGGMMREQMGRCIALTGRIGVDVSCSIYDCRPEICQVMEKGSWACNEIRAASFISGKARP